MTAFATRLLGRLLPLFAGVVAVCAGGFDFLAGNWVCAQDTSFCAFGHEKNGVYAGTLATPRGRPLRNQPFDVYFESRRDEPVVRLRSDSRGKFCIVWAQERVGPVAGASGTPINLPLWRPLRGAAPRAGCEATAAQIPWNRASDLTSRWQYLSVLVITAFSVLALILPVGAKRRRLLRLAGIGAALIALGLCIAVWV
jgi:hypothetical protein